MNRPYTLVVPSRGCPHHCTYCTAPMYDGKRLRLRTPSRVVDEIEEIKKRGTVSDFVMWTDTFTLDKSFVLELCSELEGRKLGVHWMCNSRVDSIDAEMARAMKAAGCTGVAFGVESGVQAILDNVRKGTTVEQGRTAFRVVSEAGIQTLAHFILGLPGETPDTILQTIAYAKEIDPTGPSSTARPRSPAPRSWPRPSARAGCPWRTIGKSTSSTSPRSRRQRYPPPISAARGRGPMSRSTPAPRRAAGPRPRRAGAPRAARLAGPHVRAQLGPGCMRSSSRPMT